MKKTTAKSISRHLYWHLFFVLILYFNCSSATDKKIYILDPDTRLALIESYEHIEADQNDEALKKLNRLVSSTHLKDYDAAVIYQTMGYAENNLGDYTAATKHFVKALALNALPDDVTHELNYTTAQLLIHIDRPEKVLQYLSQWFAKEPDAKAEAYILAATAYYYLEDYGPLITHAEKALTLSPAPPLGWYELLLAGYYKTRAYQKSATLLETIIAQHPKKTDYWLQLAEVYQRLKQEKKALAIYELAYTKALLEKDGIMRLINHYRYLNMPYKAAEVIEQALASGDIDADSKMLTLLADSWLLANENENAELVFIELIKKFNDDTTRLRLGQLYIEAEKWEKTIAVLNATLQSTDIRLKSKASLLLGIALYHTTNPDKAIRAFMRALSDEATKQQAKWWLAHVCNTQPIPNALSACLS